MTAPAMTTTPTLAALRNLLNTAELDRPLDGHAAAWLAAIIRRHPAATAKIGPGIAGFVVRIVPEYGSRAFYVLRTDGTEASFSYRRCFPAGPVRPRSAAPARPRTDGDVAKAIADALHEDDPLVRKQILRTLKVLGRPKVARLLQETQAIHNDGGLLINDGSRQRTKGGIFFWLVRQRVTEDEARALWPWRYPAPEAAPRQEGAA